MTKFETFGSTVPMGEPSWYQGLNTSFYNASHVAWRQELRDFCEEHVEAIINKWDKAAVEQDHETCYKYLTSIYAESAKRGLLPSVVGKPWPAAYTSFKGPENYDYFHELITNDEITRAGGGFAWSMAGGLGIGLPPVLNFGIPGDKALQEKVAKEVLAGEKIICLGITEPGAGSDVSALATVAEDKGDHFIVNGDKRWITNGIYAHYFTVAVRTGKPGHQGISMLLMDRSMPGIETTKMDCMGVWTSGTTYIKFQDVKVPKTNIIGRLNEGFKQVMFNFNHERWLLVAQASRMARTCIEEAMGYARSRRTFGKALIEHQVIQHKLAEMGRLCEASHAWLENITFQMNTMSKEEQNARLGGHIALLKVQATKTVEFCAREALQIFGGSGYTRGTKVERVYREVRAFAIPGGSEEIMLNLAAGQMKFVTRATPDPRDKLIKQLKTELETFKKGGTAGTAAKL